MQPVSTRCRLRQLALVAAIGVSLVAGSDAVRAQPQPSAAAGPKLAELERAFWICDWTATASVLDVDAYSACAATADELKARKFGGDFERMIGWWREHKAAAHAGLQARRLAAEPRR